MWPFSTKPKKKAPTTAQAVRLRWDAASHSPEMQKHFSGADNLGADRSLTAEVRKTIASRVRWETENNSFCAGIVGTLISHAVGKGVGLQLELAKQGQDALDLAAVRACLDRRESRFRVWASVIDLDSLLRICRRSRCVDGEVFVLLTDNKNLRNECKLFPVAYESSQVTSSFSSVPLRTPDGELIEFDGIRYDKYGNPVAYSINLNPDLAGISINGQWFSADQVLHFAHILRPGQHRGVSELASAVAVFNDIRRYSNSTLAAAEGAAQLSFVIQTDLTSLDDEGQRTAVPIEPGTYLESAQGGGVALPEGWSISQLQPTNPTSNYCQYLESKIREAARALNMPLMVALADSSGGNYSSSRADQQIWARKIDVDRQELVKAILNPIYQRWSELDKALHPADYAYEAHPRWGWQPFVSLDPVKDENASKQRLENRTTTLAIECSRKGLDWESVLLQQAREKEFADKLGLTIYADSQDGEKAQEEDKEAEQ